MKSVNIRILEVIFYRIDDKMLRDVNRSRKLSYMVSNYISSKVSSQLSQNIKL
jgi:hypothetical protein